MRKLISFFALSLLILSSTAAEHKELKAFPAAKEGMERVVIVLPHKDRKEEGSFKVELIPGKEVMTDGVNRYFIGLSVQSKPLKGWGYTYYEVTGNQNVGSTKMAALGKQQQVRKFVKGKGLTVRYNSRLPIVIYVPKGVEVRYRIWKAPAELKKASKG